MDLVRLTTTDVAVLLGDGGGSFGPPIFYHLGPTPDNNLAVADLNNDGKLDVVVNGNGSLTTGVSVLIGNGAGSFAAVVPSAAPVFLDKIALSDFNDDGKVDLASSSQTGVWVMFGDGSGSFGTAVQYATAGNFLSGLEVADFNGDGKTDLVTARPSSDEVSVLLNDGHGQFSTVKKFPSSTRSSRVAVGDFNVDGKADVVTAGSSVITPNNISVLLGDGAGNLVLPVNTPADSTNFLLSGDLNGDGKDDLIQGTRLGTLGILLGDGTGHFGAPREFSPNNYVFSLSAIGGDFNEDGKLDVATNYITIAYGDGTGGLRAAPSLRVGNDPASIGTGDFNEDGKRDLIVANATDNSVSLLLRNETGGYAPPTTLAVGPQPKFVAIADFNGDHHLDFATANSVSSVSLNSGTISIRLGDGTGNFSPATHFPSGNVSTSLVVGDFNRDTKLDLAVTNIGYRIVTEAGLLVFPPSLVILIGDGAGGFAAPQAVDDALINLIPPNDPEIRLSIAAGDLNNDSKLDLVVATATTLTVLLGDGTGSFSDAIPYPAADKLNSVVLGDFDNDGNLDVATGSGTMSVLLGDGSGHLGSAHDVAAPVGMVYAAGDFNSDNNLDLVVSTVTGLAIMLGDGAGNFGAFTAFLGGRSATVDDLDGDGKLDIATPGTTPSGSGSNSISILINICGASVNPTPTPTPTPTATPTPSPSPTPTPSPAPVLLTEEGTNHAVAFDSVTLTRGPFAVHTDVNFSPDQRTRILLFGMNIQLLPGENASNITVKAENTGGNISTLVVESVRPVPGFSWMTQLVVKLPDELEVTGDVQMSISLHGVTSNKALVTIKAGP